MLWVAGVPIKKPKIKCEACNKHYIPSKQIIIMCGYFRTENPFCKWCQKLPIKELNEMLGCKTGEIIKSEMTCKKCQQYPSLNNESRICINCEKELK